jgi:transglutaminase-like putative cysteine protease
MRSSDRLILASTVAVLLISFTAGPLTSDNSYLGQSWFVVLVLAAATVGLRRARLTAGFVFAAQLALLAALLFIVSSFAPSQGGGPWYFSYVDLWLQGVEHMQTQSAPMEPDPGVEIIFGSVIGVIFVLTDLLVSGLDRPAWGIVPPAAAFVVPALGLGMDTGVAPFLCLALGYLGILVADGLNRTGRWTRGLSRDSADGFGTATPVVWRAAGIIGVPALLATMVLGVMLPTLSLPGLGIGGGTGGNGPLQLTDPTLDLRRNLNQAADTVVIRYSTDKPGGLYLRMASLPQFDASGWRNVQMSLERGTDLTQIPGVDGEIGERRTTEISVLDFGSEYLPLPYAPRTVDVPGDWAYDPNSLIVLSWAGSGRDDAIRNLDYTVESNDVDPDAEALARAVAGTPADSSITAELPPDLPDELQQLTRDVTEGADTDAAKAWAIQEFLRDTSNFTYSTEPLPGSGYRALENFLLRDHRGYCEQFAAAMAMMAREVEIPSRVAVGFLPGERVEGNTWEVSIRDMHAWPELFFAGYGWVRFEPTPASVTGTPPSWTVPQSESTSDDETLNPSDVPSASASQESVAPSADPTAGQDQVGTGSGFGRRTLIGTGIGLVVLAVLAAPATIRFRRRSARLSGEGAPEEVVEDVWAELRDTVVDYGGTWPDGSPRSIGTTVGGRLSAEDSAAMGQVAVLVEQGRYARSLPGAGLETLPEMTQQIRRGLAPESRWRRFAATVLPKSLFKRRGG